MVNKCEESLKREADVMVMADELVGVETSDEQTRATIKKGLKHLREVMVKEKAAQELSVEVHERKQQLEDDLLNEVDDYIYS